jgi:hypothetical protein
LKARIERMRAEDPDSYMVRREDEKAAKRTARATGKRVCAYCKTHRKSVDQWEWSNMDESEKADSRCLEATMNDRWGDSVRIAVEYDTLYGLPDSERGVGHSIRACKYRKADIADCTSQIKAARVSHMKRMIDNGIGPGATVVFADDTQAFGEYPSPGAFVVASVKWAHLGLEGVVSGYSNDFTNVECLEAVHVAHIFNQNPPYGARRCVTLPMDLIQERTSTYRSSYTSRVQTLHKRASEEKVRNSIPFGWADATDDATQSKIHEDLMRDVKSRSKKK